MNKTAVCLICVLVCLPTSLVFSRQPNVVVFLADDQGWGDLSASGNANLGCVGHSLGGHTSLFAAAFEPRLAASCCNCGVLAWFADLQDKHHWARPESAILKDGPPALAYVYIKKFSRCYDPGNTDPVPVDFESLMMMAAPRPLLIMANEPKVAGYHLVDKVAQARKVYRTLGAGDRLALFSFPGGHNYPPVAKRHSFNWLDRWLDHTPAVPTIWPNESV